MSGEQELDRIIAALNQAGERLGEARRQSEWLNRQVAAAERLASIGRLAAGLAHEIRNPIAAMRLKAENILAKGSQHTEALKAIIEQIDRLDRLVADPDSIRQALCKTNDCGDDRLSCRDDRALPGPCKGKGACSLRNGRCGRSEA